MDLIQLMDAHKSEMEILDLLQLYIDSHCGPVEGREIDEKERQYLIQSRLADIVNPGGSRSPLMAAIRSNYPKLVMLLLYCGANPNAVEYDQSCLEAAVFSLKSEHAIVSLLEAGAEPIFRNGSSVLHTAMFWNRESLAVLLCRHYSELINHRDAEQKRPIDIAMELHHYSTGKVMLCAGSMCDLRSVISSLKLETQPYGNGFLMAYLQKQIVDNNLEQFKAIISAFSTKMRDEEVVSNLFMYQNNLIELILDYDRVDFLSYVAHQSFSHYLSDNFYMEKALELQKPKLVNIIFKCVYKKICLEQSAYKLAQWLDGLRDQPLCRDLFVQVVGERQQVFESLRQDELIELEESKMAFEKYKLKLVALEQLEALKKLESLDQAEGSKFKLEEVRENLQMSKTMIAVAQEMCYARRVLKSYHKHNNREKLQTIQEARPQSFISKHLARSLSSLTGRMGFFVSIAKTSSKVLRIPSPIDSRAASPLSSPCSSPIKAQ